MAYRYLMEEGEDLKAIPNTDIAKLVKVSEKTVRNVKDEVLLRIDANSDSPNDQKIKQPPVQTDPTAEIDRLQKDLNKAVEMATAAEAKAAELYKAREKIRLETEARAKAEKELQTFRAEMQKSQEEEIARRLEELKQTLEPVEKIVEKQVAVEDPATAFRLKKAEEQRDKYEMELKKIQQEGRDWRRLEDKKSKLELEIDKLQMRALEKRAETTLMAALDNVEHSRYISDRIHDMCQRGEMTLEQLDNAERTMTAMVNAGNDCLVVIRAEREGLVKAKGGLRVVE
jgi:DNA repair exonuclease SbcCD ATPase subunit